MLAKEHSIPLKAHNKILKFTKIIMTELGLSNTILLQLLPSASVTSQKKKNHNRKGHTKCPSPSLRRGTVHVKPASGNLNSLKDKYEIIPLSVDLRFICFYKDRLSC